MSIKIYYGPYEAHGVIRHREQKLHGALNRLEELGFNTELIPSPFINVVTVYMQNKQIFRCDIRNLLFNMDCIEDPVAQLLVAAVEEARDRFYSDLNVPSFSLIDEDGNYTSESIDSHHMYIIPSHDNEKMKKHKMHRHEGKKSSHTSSHEVEVEHSSSSDKIVELTLEETEDNTVYSTDEQDTTVKIPEQQSQSHLQVGSRTQSTEETILSEE